MSLTEKVEAVVLPNIEGQRLCFFSYMKWSEAGFFQNIEQAEAGFLTKLCSGQGLLLFLLFKL